MGGVADNFMMLSEDLSPVVKLFSPIQKVAEMARTIMNYG